MRKHEKELKSGKISKDNSNKRGYNKFLEITKGVEVSITEQKVSEDEKKDGLMEYFTNSFQPKKSMGSITNYRLSRGLFRVIQGAIELRPIFIPSNAQAHVALCFVACKGIRNLSVS